MDLLTLVSVCSIAFEPAVTHSLIWHESRGEPWSYRLAGEGLSYAFPSMTEAIDAARQAQSEVQADNRFATIRVGLTGLEVDLEAATAQPNEAMFEPCANVTIASTRLARLAERCVESDILAGSPTFCAVAVYRGSWEEPDIAFADAVMFDYALERVPNPSLPPREPVPETAEEAPPIQSEAASVDAAGRAAHAPLFVPLGIGDTASPATSTDTLFVPLTRGRVPD